MQDSIEIFPVFCKNIAPPKPDASLLMKWQYFIEIFDLKFDNDIAFKIFKII